MSQSLSSKTVEFASGATGALPFNLDGSSNYLYPLVQEVPGELGGMSVYFLAAAATTNANVIKSSPGMVYGVSLYNMEAGPVPVFVTFYDVASTPTVDTTTIKMKFGCPALSTTLASVKDWSFPLGIAFSTGIAIAVHSGITTSVAITALNKVQLNVWYK